MRVMIAILTTEGYAAVSLLSRLSTKPMHHPSCPSESVNVLRGSGSSKLFFLMSCAKDEYSSLCLEKYERFFSSEWF